jgi:transcriptional regulator of acetoin/glycerol metabolism
LRYPYNYCGIRTTTDDAARERAAKEALVEKLHLERVSQRGIARLTGMSRSTIIKRLKKDLSSDWPNHNSLR